MKLYYDVNHHANCNTNSQSGDVDNCVIYVSDKGSEGCFEIILKHRQVVFGHTAQYNCQSVLCKRIGLILFRTKNKPALRYGEIIYKQGDLLMTESGFLSMEILLTGLIQELLPEEVNAWFLSGFPSL